MPVYGTSTAAPIVQSKSPLSIMTDRAKNFANALRPPTPLPLQLARETGLVKVEPTSVKGSLKAAWTDSVPTPDQLKVWSVPLPVGAVLTHETVKESVGYRAYPLADVTPISISAQVQTQYKQITYGKGNSKVTVMQAFFDVGLRENAQYAGGQAAQESMAKSIEIIRGTEGKTVSQIDVQKDVNKENDALLKVAGNEQAIRKLRQRIGKIYLGDPEPKMAELRFVVHDVVGSQADGIPQLSRHRFQVATDLHRMFCANGMGTNEVSSAYTALADAARLNADATGGHIVQLSSPGIDGFGVDRWLVTSYEQKQVPNLDVIAVRVLLVELLSVLSAHVEQPGVAPNMPIVDSSAPPAELPVRPNYIATNVGVVG